ncbi:MAG: nitroreductase family protein [Tannerella sp.]|nr:nitroreductase family protein [Tannerella sp.]
MTVTDQIKHRRSVRTYTGEPLTDEHVALIEQYINNLQPPFGAKVRIVMIHGKQSTEPLKLGTYGWIKGACDFLALVFEEASLAEIAAAYVFEQTLLYCTSLGLGTCWLGGSFNRADFKKQVPLAENEKLKIVSPVGYPADKQRWFIERLVVNADKNHSSRKPFGETFFDGEFSQALTETKAGIYAEPLNMVRLAPSANNWQEWRIVLSDSILHFYKTPPAMYNTIDIGIAMCHFAETCRELGIKGEFKVLTDYHDPNGKAEYVISWVKS